MRDAGALAKTFKPDSRRTSTDDFERNSGRTYILGEGRNVHNAEMNDPRSPYELFTENLDRFPVYIRHNGGDHWNLESVTVTIGNGEVQYAALLGTDNLWLGKSAGGICYLFKISPTIP